MKNYKEFLDKLEVNASKNVDDLSLKLLGEINNLQAKEQVMKRKGGGMRRTHMRGGHRGGEFEDPNNPIILAQAQTDLAEKDTSSFIQNVLSVHLNNAFINGLPFFPSNNNLSNNNMIV